MLKLQYFLFITILGRLVFGNSDSSSSSDDDSYSSISSSVATFNVENTGVSGYISVKGGKVTVSLNFSNVNVSALPSASCFDNGLTYHIHTKWNYTDTKDRIGASPCATGFTGGHYDPWLACGPLTGNPYCQVVTTNDWGCIPNGGSQGAYNCSIYHNNIFACEVGDWSGKYGNLHINSSGGVYTTNQSFWEVDAEDVEGLSVVLHCANTGSRALCAPFILSTDDDDDDDEEEEENYVYNIQSTQEYVGESTVYANFGDYGSIRFGSTGSICVNIFNEIDEEEECDNGYNVYIYNSWTSNSDEYLTGDDCNSNIFGAIWDPTISCIPGSEYDDVYCDGEGHRCDNLVDYTYDCDYQVDPYLCAVSDLSGKFSTMSSSNNNNNNYYYYSWKDELLPRLDDLLGKSVVISCNSDDNTVIACAEITSTNSNNDSDGNNKRWIPKKSSHRSWSSGSSSSSSSSSSN